MSQRTQTKLNPACSCDCASSSLVRARAILVWPLNFATVPDLFWKPCILPELSQILNQKSLKMMAPKNPENSILRDSCERGARHSRKSPWDLGFLVFFFWTVHHFWLLWAWNVGQLQQSFGFHKVLTGNDVQSKNFEIKHMVSTKVTTNNALS